MSRVKETSTQKTSSTGTADIEYKIAPCKMTTELNEEARNHPEKPGRFEKEPNGISKCEKVWRGIGWEFFRIKKICDSVDLESIIYTKQD